MSFGEPWRVNAVDRFGVSIESQDDAPDTQDPVAYMARFSDADRPQDVCEKQAAEDVRNAERIVACVNALRGLDPSAVARVLEAARKLRQRMLERDKSGEFYAAEEVVLAVEALDA